MFLFRFFLVRISFSDFSNSYSSYTNLAIQMFLFISFRLFLARIYLFRTILFRLSDSVFPIQCCYLELPIHNFPIQNLPIRFSLQIICIFRTFLFRFFLIRTSFSESSYSYPSYTEFPIQVFLLSCLNTVPIQNFPVH